MGALQQITEMATHLKEDMQLFTNHFNKFTEQSIHTMNQKQQAFLLMEQEIKEKIRVLTKLEGELKTKISNLEQDYQREAKEEAALSQKLAQLRVKERHIPDQLQQLRQHLDQVMNQLSFQRNLLAENEKSKRHIMVELSKALSFYRTRLGLEFHRVGANRLRLMFHCIDPQDENKEFYFSLFINSMDKYEVEECSPCLPASSINAALEDLNCGGDFGTFIRRFRNLFKETVNSRS